MEKHRPEHNDAIILTAIHGKSKDTLHITTSLIQRNNHSRPDSPHNILWNDRKNVHYTDEDINEAIVKELEKSLTMDMFERDGAEW